MVAKTRPTLEQRLKAKLLAGDGGCLLWSGSKNKKGYGQISVRPCFPGFAHRVAWQLANGPMRFGVCRSNVSQIRRGITWK